MTALFVKVQPRHQLECHGGVAEVSDPADEEEDAAPARSDQAASSGSSSKKDLTWNSTASKGSARTVSSAVAESTLK